MQDISSRVLAAKILTIVIKKQLSMPDAISEYKKQNLKIKNIDSLTKNICFGTLRFFYELEFYYNLLIKKKLPAKQIEIKALIFIGFYQILYMETPPYAAINETVNAAKKTKFPFAPGLINAVLNNFLKQKETLIKNKNKNLSANFSHPTWFIEKIKNQYPDRWQDILINNNKIPPQTVRINLAKTTKEKYSEILSKNNIKHNIDTNCETGVIISPPVDPVTLPEFNNGFCSIQDLASQKIMDFISFELKDNNRILDACAAPGGKTCLILEKNKNINLTAIEISKKRIHYIEENLKRLNLTAKIINADSSDIESWYDNMAFDTILLDAPCTASGIIRRHPDLKILRKPEDLANIIKTQKKLLDNLWKTLKPKGVLLYTTCSIFHEENMNQIKDFVKNNKCILEKQTSILPGENNMDGFFYAKLIKN